MRLLSRRPVLTELDEAAAYERCHGSRDNDVRIVKLPPRRPRYDVLTTGEDLRALFELRLESRESEADLGPRETGSEEPASRRSPAT